MGARLNIAEIRQRSFITQAELAEKLGIKRTTLSHYETGRRRVPVSLLVPIKDALGCTLDELFGEEASDEEDRAHAEAG